MKNQQPKLTEIAAAVQTPAVPDLPTVLIARSDPDDLNSAVNNAISETVHTDSVASGTYVNIYEASQDELAGAVTASTARVREMHEEPRNKLKQDLTYRQLEGFGPPTDEELDQYRDLDERAKNVEPSETGFYINEESKKLTEKAQKVQQDAIKELDALSFQTKLAQEIDETRRRLSRPVRYAAAVLCAAVLGTGLGGVSYQKVNSVKQQTKERAIQSGNTANLEKADDYIPEIVGTGGAIAGIILGGTIGGAGAGTQSNRIARRRAQRIVKKAEQQQN